MTNENRPIQNDVMDTYSVVMRAQGIIQDTMVKASQNQKMIAKNPYQTAIKKVLCVCSAGVLRSPTMANILHKKYGYNTRSCGIALEYALIPISEALIEWADEVICVEKSISDLIPNKYNNGTNIYTLNIPDNFSYMDEKLQEMILEQYGNKSLVKTL